jgi:hypothetical protein
VKPPASRAHQQGSATDRIASCKKAPPRVKKPSKHSDVVLAPSAELEEHKAAFRDVFGKTLSDEFVDVMLTQLVSALRPDHSTCLRRQALYKHPAVQAADVRIAQIKVSTWKVVSEAQVWNPDYAFAYATFAMNSAGDLGYGVRRCGQIRLPECLFRNSGRLRRVLPRHK